LAEATVGEEAGLSADALVAFVPDEAHPARMIAIIEMVSKPTRARRETFFVFI